ncbi:hypothetical protein T459_10788 [Capsicum annuum]|uniref:Retrotransposon gag domain-containing protein n=1 Tax=Capsicum annuum TaxID=4072 RepID=A0A2G3A378_CAPAN|nr:hypothetical protein T459_10788 [Capsicum annuum]
MNVSSAREMNDSLAAITQRQPQRTCGCVGIFFQLFDRNRRFAKKLFPKKLLSPACLKQASKKFGGDEKQPKLRLIADENSGGFPNAKNNGMTNTRCESKREMKAPSLVSRLMDLESMPAGSGSKPQKASASETWSNVADKLGARPGESDKEDMDFEVAEIKSLELGLRRFRAKCALTYPTRYFSPLEDEADLVGNALDQHSSGCVLESEELQRTDHRPFYNVSGVLSKIDQLKGRKLSYAKQVILNTELIFGTTPQQQGLPVEDGFSVSHFLLNEHEMFSSLLWMTCGELLGCNDLKQMNQLKGFAFDCLLEYLYSKFSRYSDSGFRTCTKLPSSMTKEILILLMRSKSGQNLLIPVNKVRTYGDLRNVLMKRIFLSALHFRINTRYKSSNPPFTSVELDHSDSGREGCTVTTLTVTAEPKNWQNAIKVAVQEVRRLKEFGVTNGELARYTDALLKDSEQLAAMIDNVSSVDNLDFVMESDALGHTIMDQSQGHESLLSVAGTITLEEVNATGAEVLEYISDFGKPSAPLPAAIVAWNLSKKRVGQNAIRLRLFPLSLSGEATLWLNELTPDSITNWRQLKGAFLERFFPPSRRVQLRNEISNFRQILTKALHETWERFKKKLT